MNSLYGLILCGGKSSRLGKSKYNIRKDGVELYTWWTNVLGRVCVKTYVSCQSSQKTEIDHPNLILDEFVHAGPLEGIYKAFQLHKTVNWLVIACDLVYAEYPDINTLVTSNEENNDGICYENLETGDPFPLMTIYNSKIYSLLKKEYHSDLKSPKRLLMHSNIKKIKPSDSIILKGINTPEDFDAWRKSV